MQVTAPGAPTRAAAAYGPGRGRQACEGDDVTWRTRRTVCEQEEEGAREDRVGASAALASPSHPWVPCAPCATLHDALVQVPWVVPCRAGQGATG